MVLGGYDDASVRVRDPVYALEHSLNVPPLFQRIGDHDIIEHFVETKVVRALDLEVQMRKPAFG